MSTQISRSFAPAANPLQRAASVAHKVFFNLAAVFDVILHARTITANVQDMADLLKQARRVEERSPEKAARLRAAARRMELA